MFRTVRPWILLWFVLGMLSPSISAAVAAGVAKREITPPLDARLGLWGYFGRNDAATGVLDPLYARALVIRSGSSAIALVTLDLGRVFDDAAMAPLRDTLLRDAKLDAVVFTASHTHAAPNVQRTALQPPPAAAWMRTAFEKIRAAVLEASSQVQPVRLGFGTGTSWIANNRRFLRPDGTVQMISRDSPKFRNFPIDPGVRVLRIDRSDGSPLAVVVHYSCHPVTLGDANLKYSADWPGAMMRTIEEEVPGHPLAIFVQGAPGDINLMMALAGKSGEHELVEIGESIGHEAARVARAIETRPEDLPLRVQRLKFSFSNRWNYDELMVLADRNPQLPFAVFRDNYAPVMNAPVTVAALGGLWGLVTMPGEPFLEFQIRLADQSPVKNAWLAGYADGYLGYFPTVRAAAEGGYGADGSETWVELGAGERMTDAALVTLFEFAGRLRPTPIPVK